MIKRRTYRCTCGWETTRLEFGDEEGPPPCPTCDEDTAQIPGLFSIKTNRSRAMDVMQSIAENERGLSDMPDNLRAGDLAVPKDATFTTHEREAMQQQIAEMASAASVETPENPMVKSAWGANGSAGAEIPIALATATAPETRARGLDAVSLIERAPAGPGPAGMKLKVIGADKVT